MAPPSVAATLTIEDALNGIVHHDKRLKYRLKCAGMIPAGVQSPFGDFPSDYKINRRPNTVVYPESGTVSLKRGKIMSTKFRLFYDRGDLPLQTSHATGAKLQWKTPVDKLDYHHYLPVFFDGLREQEDPVRFLAVQGCFEMLHAAEGTEKVVNVIPQLIMPMKIAFNTKDPLVVSTIIKAIQAVLRTSKHAGRALVPYYRQLLPSFSLFRNLNRNLGDKIDYGQRKGLCLGDLVNETLEMMEISGGPDALVNIKYIVPTYESAVTAHSKP